MNFIALRMLMSDRAKYFGLVFAFAFSTFLLLNQMSIFAGIMKRTGSQVLDVTDADIWVMDPYTEYFEQTKALKDTDLARVRAWCRGCGLRGPSVQRQPHGQNARWQVRQHLHAWCR
jgi:putative ABC transport system permease protein